MVYANSLEIRTDDNRLICRARLIEGDILLTLKSAGKEVHVPYTDIPRLVAKARERAKGHKQKFQAEITTKRMLSPRIQ